MCLSITNRCLVITLIIASCGLLSFDNPIESPNRTVFAVSLSSNSVNSEMTYSIVTLSGKKVVYSRHISQNDFIYMASGNWKSTANPNNEDLFQLNNVEGGIFLDSATFEKIPYCPALDSLWKLRYNFNPYQPNEPGWSIEQYKPSEKQALYLYNRYGLYNINTGYIADTAFWQLLRDVTNPDWITNYKSLRL